MSLPSPASSPPSSCSPSQTRSLPAFSSASCLCCTFQSECRVPSFLAPTQASDLTRTCSSRPSSTSACTPHLGCGWQLALALAYHQVSSLHLYCDPQLTPCVQCSPSFDPRSLCIPQATYVLGHDVFGWQANLRLRAGTAQLHRRLNPPLSPPRPPRRPFSPTFLPNIASWRPRKEFRTSSRHSRKAELGRKTIQQRYWSESGLGTANQPAATKLGEQRAGRNDLCRARYSTSIRWCR